MKGIHIFKSVKSKIYPYLYARQDHILSKQNDILGKQETLLNVQEKLSNQCAELLEKSEIEKKSIDSLYQSINMIASETRFKDKIRCVFLVHNIEAWANLHAVYEEMLNDETFQPTVISIQRRYPGAETYQDEEKNHQGLARLNVKHIRFNDADSFADLQILKAIAPHVIFRQSHWEPDVPPAFRTEHIGFAKLYYLSYGIAPIAEHAMMFLSTYYHNMCSKIFLSSQEVYELVKDYNKRNDRRLVVTGHPKVNFLLHAKPSWPISSGNDFKVIWSAHHSIGRGWNDFGVFPDVYEPMLRLAQTHQDVDFLFSPHPALITTLAALRGEPKERIDLFFTAWNGLPNTGIIDNGEYQGVFKSSDLLIVDGLSFLIEYQLVNKPILFLDRAGRAKFNAFGKIVEAGVHNLKPTEFDKIAQYIQYFKQGGQDDKRENQKKLIALLTRESTPEKNIVAEIKRDFVCD
ncbi:hypothetical protein [Martelella alba]|uniref:CDP-glycerol glycerophosphotransferase (TagB/SpsB family) n=1 Tax=Martelella alba TaxID=2590451 RepID=A0ABY2SLZ3_9HYPH|nr:hypothetical protein [Martelella alba]TKI05355.1 hypothetical protein FCN80_14680 [Martelella alba]